jgi:hypothetical protein
MATQFRVEKVVGQDTWDSNFGPMIGWKLVVRNLSNDQVGNAALNSKPGNKYEPGQTFWADLQGEKGGVVKLKRVKPPEGAAPTPSAGSSNGSSGAVPYSKALRAYQRFHEDLTVPEHATTLFIAWLKGQVGDPPVREPGEDEPVWGDE